MLPPHLQARLDAMASKLASEPVTASDFDTQSDAQRQQARRERAKEAGIKLDTREHRSRSPQIYDPQRSVFQRGEFIGIDGEGVSEGPILRYSFPSPAKGGAKACTRLYEAQRHYMMLLAASTGDELISHKGRLGARECLDFLLHLASKNKGAILVCFGGSYDVNQMLLYDLPRHALRKLSRGIKLVISLDGHAYKLEYRARKCLNVWRWSTSEIGTVYDKKGRLIPAPHEAHACLWDTIGFFQASFREVMSKWLGEDHPDYQLIEAMKAKRDIFTRAMLDEMRVYNQAECKALVAICNKLRSAVQQLGLTLNRWDGAGAIAAAMNKAHSVKQSKGATPDDVFHAARSAFSGGHIEICRLGTFNRPIYHYDISSAYPSIICNLPRLDQGAWIYGTDFDPPPGHTLVRVRYSFANNLPFYPLFFRCIDGTIIYPQDGEGWYWYPEFAVAREYAMRHGATEYRVIEWYHWQPASEQKPFAFVQALYDQRKDMDRKIKAGNLAPEDQWITGGEKVIKLGLNSAYGKMAQQIGGTTGEPPPYFQLDWAGYVTSGCRAQLMEAGLQNPGAIISFATDGIYSTEPLQLDCPADKILGTWEFKQHAGMVVAMPGVYWVFEAGETIGQDKPGGGKGAFSRGFDKETTSTPDLVLQAWQNGKFAVDIPSRRLITMGSACTTTNDKGALWRVRGRFVSGTRSLDISGGSIKRMPPRKRCKLWQTDARTEPRPNWRFLDWLIEGAPADDPRGISAPYSILWLDEPGDEDGLYDAGLIEQQEELDADDTLW